MKLIKLFFLSLLSMMLVACGGEGSGLPSQPDLPVTMQSLQLTPAKSIIPVGLSQQYIVEARFSDGHVEDVTKDPRIKLHISDTNIATIDNNGLATGVTPGQVTVTVTGVDSDVTLTNDAILIVTEATITSLEITPKQAIVPVGVSQQYEAIAILSDGNRITVTTQPTLTWYTDNNETASISNNNATKGSAVGKKVGDVTVTAVGHIGEQEFSDTAKLYVTDALITELTVTPSSATIPVDTEQQYEAIARFSDGITRNITTESSLNWSSSNNNIATINNSDNKGLAKGVALGDTTVVAIWNTPTQTLSDNAGISVTTLPSKLALEVSPEQSVVEGDSTPFRAWLITADGTRLTEVTKLTGLSWGTDDSEIATISNSRYSTKGWATGVNAGQTRISASFSLKGRLITGESTLTVTPISVKLRITPSNICLNQTPSNPAMVSYSSYPIKIELRTSDSSPWVDIATSNSALSWSISGDDLEQSVFNFDIDASAGMLTSFYRPTADSAGVNFIVRTVAKHWLVANYTYNGSTYSAKALIGAYVEGPTTPLTGPLLGYAPLCPYDAITSE